MEADVIEHVQVVVVVAVVELVQVEDVRHDDGEANVELVQVRVVEEEEVEAAVEDEVVDDAGVVEGRESDSCSAQTPSRAPSRTCCRVSVRTTAALFPSWGSSGWSWCKGPGAKSPIPPPVSLELDSECRLGTGLLDRLLDVLLVSPPTPGRERASAWPLEELGISLEETEGRAIVVLESDSLGLRFRV